MAGAVRSGAEPVKAGRDAGQLYGQFCANCHGGQLEGAKAPSLRPDQLKHGRDDEALVRGIHDGYPANGMPAFARAA